MRRVHLELLSTEEMKEGDQKPNEQLFTHKDDFLNLSEVVRDFPLVNEVSVKSFEHYNEILKVINEEPQSIPMFLKDTAGIIHIISSLNNTLKIEKGKSYIGKTIVKKVIKLIKFFIV